MRRARVNTLRNRLLALIFAITAAAVGFVYLYVVPQLESSLTAEKLSRLQQDGLRQRAALAAAARRGDSQERVAILLRRISQATDSRVTLLGVAEADGEPAPGFVIGDSEGELEALQSRFEVAAEAAAGRSAAGVESVGGERTAEVALPIPAGDPAWVAVFSEPLDEVEDNVALIRRQILIAGAIALVLALVAGFWAARALSLRLSRLEAAAEQAAAGDFATRIPVDSSDELGQLARTFNEMQRKLHSLDSARKQFIANASHELRTPIFSLGGFVELLEDEDPDPEARAEFVRTMRSQVERLTKLTTDLLDLSKLDSGEMRTERRRVELGVLARQVAEEFGPPAAQRGSRLQVRTPPTPAVALADPGRVSQIIRILIDNALTHTPEGTKVTVTTVQEDRHAKLIVSDEGPGIPQREQKRIFERFYTADSAGGSGLGLAIARELAAHMDGRLTLTSTRNFTAFTLELPPAARRRGGDAPPVEARA